MKYFSQAAFERLLFPLHKNVYKGIDKLFISMERRYPGSINYLCSIFDLVFTSATSECVSIPVHMKNYDLPSFDIYIDIGEKLFKNISKTQNYATFMRQHEPSSIRKGMHLIITQGSNKGKSAFIVPVQLVLKKFEKKVCRPDTYQVYEHNLIKEQYSKPEKLTREGYLVDSASYIGITKRSWQKRFREHVCAARRGSHLLFHKALRGELFPTERFEHQILRAGLSSTRALEVEEIEVEQRTLNATHSNGLNMIPGGQAGIRFLATMTKRKPGLIDPDTKEIQLEEIVNNGLRQEGIGIKQKYKNEKLAELWREDIKFRISVMTNRTDRLSYRQILNARIWSASGWNIEKIHKEMKLIDKRDASIQQVHRLLKGISYETIPHVLIDTDIS